MLFLLGWLNQRVDNIAEDMKWFVDVTAFPQPLSFYIGMLNSLAASQVNDIELGFLDLDKLIFLYFRFNHDGENDMRSWTLSVHASIGYFSCFVTLQKSLDSLLIRTQLPLDNPLNENPLLMVLSDLMHPFVWRKLNQNKSTKSKIC